MYIDNICKQTIILFDKTKVVHHEDDKCKERCISKRRDIMPKTKEEEELINENYRIGQELENRLKSGNNKRNILTDNEFIDTLIEERNK